MNEPRLNPPVRGNGTLESWQEIRFVIVVFVLLGILGWFGLYLFAAEAANQWTRGLRYSLINDQKNVTSLSCKRIKYFNYILIQSCLTQLLKRGTDFHNS